MPERLEQHVLTSPRRATPCTSTHLHAGTPVHGSRVEAHTHGCVEPERWAVICAPRAGQLHVPHETAAEPPSPLQAGSRSEHSVCKNPADNPHVQGPLSTPQPPHPSWGPSCSSDQPGAPGAPDARCTSGWRGAGWRDGCRRGAGQLALLPFSPAAACRYSRRMQRFIIL